MRLLQKLLKKRTHSPGIVAISFLANGFAVAEMRYSEHNRPNLHYCEFVASSERQFLPKLEALVKNRNLEDYDCHILLTPDQYRSMTIEMPALSGEEIKQAVRWRIGDLLDYPVEQAIIDFYPLPQSNRANSTPMLEVVACADHVASRLIQLCEQAGLNVKVIDVQETALRNLATLLRENEQGIALLHLQKDSGRIVIQKQGSLYLSRKIGVGYAQLAGDDPHPDQAEHYTEQNAVALEIQRSLDFVENVFDIPPISGLAVVLLPVDTQQVVNFLSIHHGITARALDLSAIVHCDSVLNDATQNICAPVIGASLRRSLGLKS
ncbi:MAG: pilus assembly protein PilM [Methylomonas sp.]|nr:pilus assembly protein PilM [Methylomonas sp.]